MQKQAAQSLQKRMIFFGKIARYVPRVYFTCIENEKVQLFSKFYAPSSADPKVDGSACIIGKTCTAAPSPTASNCTRESFANFHFLQFIAKKKSSVDVKRESESVEEIPDKVCEAIPADLEDGIILQKFPEMSKLKLK